MPWLLSLTAIVRRRRVGRALLLPSAAVLAAAEAGRRRRRRARRADGRGGQADRRSGQADRRSGQAEPARRRSRPASQATGEAVKPTGRGASSRRASRSSRPARPSSRRTSHQGEADRQAGGARAPAVDRGARAHGARAVPRAPIKLAPKDASLKIYEQQALGKLGKAELVLEGKGSVTVDGHKFRRAEEAQGHGRAARDRRGRRRRRGHAQAWREAAHQGQEVIGGARCSSPAAAPARPGRCARRRRGGGRWISLAALLAPLFVGWPRCVGGVLLLRARLLALSAAALRARRRRDGARRRRAIACRSTSARRIARRSR